MKNPPAFPRPASEYTENGTLQEGNDAIREQDGMTLRDYFAAAALTGIKSNPELLRICSEAAMQRGGRQQDYIAQMSYVDADAMLEARGQ